MQADRSLELADGLDGLAADLLAVYGDALGGERLGEVRCRDRTEEFALLGLHRQRQRQVGDGLGQSLCVGQDLGVLVGALLEVLGEDLLGGGGSRLGVALGIR